MCNMQYVDNDCETRLLPVVNEETREVGRGWRRWQKVEELKLMENSAVVTSPASLDPGGATPKVTWSFPCDAHVCSCSRFISLDVHHNHLLSLIPFDSFFVSLTC